MPNDAKVGFVIGVGVVVAIAAVFFRKEPVGMPTGPETAAVAAPAGEPVPGRRGQLRPVKAKTANMTKDDKNVEKEQ